MIAVAGDGEAFAGRTNGQDWTARRRSGLGEPTPGAWAFSLRTCL